MTRAIQVKIGMRIIVMPGARMLSTVTMRLTAPASEAMPVISRPSVQKLTPSDGENGVRAVRGVHEPAAVGAAAEEPRRVDEDAAEEERPEAERVQAGERDVARADLQRDHVVGERRRHRHHEEEHHRGGVHREHLVVLVGRQDVALGPGELGTDEARLEAADDEERPSP